MEITFVKTLPYNHNNITFYNTLTFRSLTYHLFWTCRRKPLRSRLREADPIASYSAHQCVPAHQPCYIVYFTFNLRSYTEKLIGLFECNCF